LDLGRAEKGHPIGDGHTSSCNTWQGAVFRGEGQSFRSSRLRAALGRPREGVFSEGKNKLVSWGGKGPPNFHRVNFLTSLRADLREERGFSSVY